MEDVKQDKPPEAGKFYVNLDGMKYKCLKIKGSKIRWMLLDSHQQGGVIDAIFEQDAQYSHYYYQLHDADEIARLERRYQSLTKDEDPLR